MEHAPSNLLGDKRIRIQINDAVYLQAIQDTLESKSLGFEPELTGRALRITLRDFFKLLDDAFGRETTSEAVLTICRQARESGTIAEDANARSLEQIAKDPSTYIELLKPLVIDRDAVSFCQRLATLIKEAKTAEKWCNGKGHSK